MEVDRKDKIIIGLSAVLTALALVALLWTVLLCRKNHCKFIKLLLILSLILDSNNLELFVLSLAAKSINQAQNYHKLSIILGEIASF